MKPNDLEVLKDFLLERMDPMDAWLVLSTAKHPSAVRVLLDRPIAPWCGCGSQDDSDYGGESEAHGIGCAVIAALKTLDHPNLQGEVDRERRIANRMYEQDRWERDTAEGRETVIRRLAGVSRVSAVGLEQTSGHWTDDELLGETIDEHERRRGALLHPSVIAARRAGAAQEDIDDIIESLIAEQNKEPLHDPD